jgi:hypothetical protein
LRTAPLPALAFAVLLGACAGGRGGPPPGFEPGPGGLGLFISPAGEPFRAGPEAPYPVSAWFAAADADHDGRLTLAEFKADAVAYFHRLDDDKDGTVDGFEVQAYERSIPEMAPRVRSLRPGEGMNMQLGRGGRGGRLDADDIGGGGRPGRSGRGAVGGREGAALYSFFYDPQPVAAADSDFNSRISLAEAQSIAERRFAMLDTARAGYLTLSGLPKTPVQQAAEARRDDDRRGRRRNGAPSGVEPPSGRERPPSP